MPWVVKVLTIFNNWCVSQKFHAYVPLFPAENSCGRVCVYVCIIRVRTNGTAAFVIVYNAPPQLTIAEIPLIIIYYDELIQYNITYIYV